jgi:two-component system, LytTR family, response regulator LytT
MNVLILEDEPLSAERLHRLLLTIDGQARVVATLDSVEEAVRHLSRSSPPDLLLADVHLADGSCFDLFRQIPIRCPVIFTTAYDQYAIQAFKVNSVDYLLKPIDADDLGAALGKLRQWRSPVMDQTLIKRLFDEWQTAAQPYKTRFLVKFGDQLSYRTVEDIAYFQADDKVVYLLTHDARRFIVDFTLEELDARLDPRQFFRLNRRTISALPAVRRVRSVLGGRLELTLAPATDELVFVSRDRAADFKKWLDGA